MNHHFEFNPLELSRHFQTLDQQNRQFLRKIRLNADYPDPFARSDFPGLRIFEKIAQMENDDILRLPLIRWAHHLIDARLQAPASRQEAQLLFHTTQPAENRQQTATSLATIRLTACASSTDNRAWWWKKVESAEKNLSTHRLQTWDLFNEMERRLDFDESEALFCPISGFCTKNTADDTPTASRTLEKLAQRVLQESRDAATELWGKGWAALMDAIMAHPAHEGWPARLAVDTMHSLYFERELFFGVQVAPTPLPARISPFSYLHAARSLGQALSQGLASRELPFVFAHAPHNYNGYELGELFSFWTASPPFLVRKLGLSRRKAVEHERIFITSQLARARLLATEVLIMLAARRSSHSVTETYVDATRQLLQEALPPSSTLARFNVHRDQASQFTAFLSASKLHHTLRESYDEDWYENPRAQGWLRAEQGKPAVFEIPSETCEQGWALLFNEVKRLVADN